MAMVIAMIVIAGIIAAIGGYTNNGDVIEAGLLMAIAACVVWTILLAIGG